MNLSTQQNLEEEIGITEFINNAKGFQGIIKQRFSDFVVREVDVDGNIVYLKELSGQELENKYFTKINNNSNTITSTSISINEDDINPLDLAKKTCIELKSLLMDNIDDKILDEKIVNYIELCIQKADDCDDSFIGYPCSNKESRTEMHKCIRNNVGPYIETDTITVDNMQHLRLFAKHKLKKSTGEKTYTVSSLVKRDNRWPKEIGNYLRFTLLKENIDTMSACNALGKTFRLKPNSIGYSGTKDKRAVTTQKITIFRRRPSEIERLNKFKYPPVMRVGDFEFVKNEVKLGQHSGNHFEIVLRAISENDDIVINACSQLQMNGFINYFGLQRFGKGGTKSHIIGKALYLSEWKKACDMLFTPQASDRKEVEDAKKFYNLQDYSQALKVIPSQLHSEKSVLESLIKDPKNFYSAYNRIVKNNRLICVHAYQSYVWNVVVSERIRLYGINCVIGDLVALNSNESILHSEEGEEDSINDHKCTIHTLSQNDLDLGLYKINDVVLPLPGYDIILPSNSIKEIYLRILEKDGLSLEHFSKCDVNYRSKGTYRHIIQYPKDFEYSISKYDDPNEEINITELTKMRLNDENMHKNSSSSEKNNLKSRRALTLKFTLKPGIYATMLLREITKESTETEYFMKLTTEDGISQKRELGVLEENEKDNKRFKGGN